MAINRRLIAQTIGLRLRTEITTATGHYGQVGRLLGGEAIELGSWTLGQDWLGEPSALPGAIAPVGYEPPTKSATDLRVQPYYVLRPGTGDSVEESLGLCDGGTVVPFTVTAAAGDLDDLLALIDGIEDALLRWIPTLAGHGFGPVRHPLGWVSPPVLPDRSVTPERLYLPLDYQLPAHT